MPLKLMYITNNPKIASIAEHAGVDRIFVDMEYIGKALRQGGMDTVQSHHTIDDIKNIRKVIKKSELLVRINPIHDKTSDYESSEHEIEDSISAGADILMLPFFKTVGEVKRFLAAVNGRVKTMLLLETPESVEHLDDIIKLPGINFVHIGINDLSLGYHKSFMFELLADGTVEYICAKLKKTGMPYGFGGIASLGNGALPSEKVILEHYRMGSSCAILSRSFCNTTKCNDIIEIENVFISGIREIREYEIECEKLFKPFQDNIDEIKEIVNTIVSTK